MFADESWMGSRELLAVKLHCANVELLLKHAFDLVNLQRLPEGACYSPLCHEASNVNERVFSISKHFKSFSDDFGFFRIDVNRFVLDNIFVAKRGFVRPNAIP
ncbi:TPA: hypothetical protein DCP77_00600 [Candidatus Collierbacteria bacterium]|nr:hypothetical protein [Candidatus Collierbacteria bacterium]HAN22275.1 hypothetical protein [Candidatus Collierbacteria bacterium]HAS68593.1 hypothetical protein [Candidatus Collierbacteria bacterium]HBX64346.1 hypothetical protein [Candidatus Collierbacteria bacterium]